ncbi:hypothetical protein [Mesobacillus jeotgali]|nr:hypothetical protein [Mesobacillus jeotgali]
MKSFFDFSGRTEATRGARRCRWTKKSASAWTEASRGVRSRS